MNNTMTKAVRDDLAKLAYVLCKDLPAGEAKGLLRCAFAKPHGLTDDMAWALYVRGKSLARSEREKGRAA